MVMISVLRVRFNTNGDLGSVWSDDVTTAWMQRLTPWSLGNYWMTASHGLLPLDSVFWPAVVMSDPRTPGADNKTNRTALTQGAADAGTAQAHTGLSSYTPAEGSTVTDQLAAVTLTFSASVRGPER